MEFHSSQKLNKFLEAEGKSSSEEEESSLKKHLVQSLASGGSFLGG